MSEPLTAGMGSIWLQYDPNTLPLYLGCHQIDEISQAKGDKTLIWCKDPTGPNKFKVAGSFRGAPEAASFTISAVVHDVADFLEDIGDDEVTIIINKAKQGAQDEFSNFDRCEILTGGTITNETETGLAARNPDDNAEHMLEIEFAAEEWLKVYPLGADRQNTTEVNAANAMCYNPSDPDELYVACDSAAGPATANILRSVDRGGTWAATATDPFGAGLDAKAIVCFPLDVNTLRIVAFRETSPGVALQCAYSDDAGATWTTVTIGAVLGQEVLHGNAVFALDRNHVWVVTDAGYVYFSDDGCVTWDLQDAGVATASDLYAVRFADAYNGMAVGVADAIIMTTDGGNTWNVAGGNTGSGDNILSCGIIDSKKAWIGLDIVAAATKLWFTDDGGDTWNPRGGFTGSGVGEIDGIEFVPTIDGQIGIMVSDNATPVGSFFRTRDGGYSWEQVIGPTNTGLLHLMLIDENEAFAVGSPEGGTAVIIHASDALA